MIRITLPIAPVAWGRVRRGAHGQAYVPEKTRRFKAEAALLASRHRPVALLDGPLKLTARFIIACPARPKFKEPAVKPDLDNYIKALKDALNGVIWTDDARICRYGEGTGKYYDKTPNPQPRIELQVEEIS